MIFAVIFFVAFAIGLVCFVVSDKWWWGFVVSTILFMVLALSGTQAPALQGVTLFFGIPIVFLGSLFGAYIVQLRRAPDVDAVEDSADVKSEQELDRSKEGK